VESDAAALVCRLDEQEESMSKTLAALTLAAGIGLVYVQSAGAVPVDAMGVKESAAAASTLRQAWYSERRTRHGVVKCYRTLVVGPYRCQYFRDVI
jgi:hypothetical protein